MGTVSPGFKGRRRGREPSAELPPGQYLVEDFPVLSAGPTPSIDLQDWELTITNETGDQRRWDWAAFRALPSEPITSRVSSGCRADNQAKPGSGSGRSNRLK